ncbi:MAG: TetR/AcrR family transcriptional regulator [Nitriliruptor sp.]
MSAATEGTTKDRLREAAIATVRERGIAGVSARTVAANAGANQASIYYHFGSLDALLSDAAQAATAGRVAAHRDRLAAVASVSELVEVARSLHAEERELGNVTVLAQMLAGAQHDRVLAEGTTAALQLWIDEVEATLQRLLAGSLLEELVDLPALARGVSAAFVGVELLDGSEDDGELPTLDALTQLAGLVQVVLDLGPVAGAAIRRHVKRSTRDR